MFNMESVLFIILISAFTTTFGFFINHYLKNLLDKKSLSKSELEQNKRESFKKLLDEHSEIFLGLFHNKPLDEWIKDYSEMRKNILLWGSDEVIYEYAQFIKKGFPQDDMKEHEMHFAKAIIAFRKEIGYKNKRNKVTPEQIVFIYRSGRKGNL